jgi:hypothetical protein
MISLSLAAALKEAGLNWVPALHDFFAIPESGLEQRVFVVSDMTIDVQKLFGSQVITFNGAVEWSLDYIMMADVVWMPSEEQLRLALQRRLEAEERPVVQLTSTQDGCRCQIPYRGEPKVFEANDAGAAYGKALLHLLQQSQ